MMSFLPSRSRLPRAAGLVVLLAILAVSLAGCGGGLFESQRIEYKTAAKLPPLEIPPDLTAPTTDDRFAVPDLAPNSTATYSSYNAERAGGPRPAERSEVLPTVPDVRLERSGTQRWLLVRQSPDKVWPVVKQFWQEVGFLIELERPEAGVMETNWSENRAKLPLDFVRRTLGRVLDSLYSTGEQDKFRTRLERGTQPGTTEIYISHRGIEEVYTNTDTTGSTDRGTRWQPRPSDPELEAELLARLMVRFGVEETKARAIVNDQQGSDRAALASGADGSLFLRLDEPFDRAWRRVGLALDRVGFTVEDRDRAKGFYFVRYQEQESELPGNKQEGFLSRLMFWRSKQTAKAEQYRILVKDGVNSNQTSQVQVLGKDGDPERSDAAKRILALLHQQLK